MTSITTAAPRTCDAIVRAAEELFAREGIEAVPLRKIARAAGQRNVAAVQYHFGSKAALVGAIVDRHQREIDDERRRRLDADEAAGTTHDLDALISVLVEPLAQKLDDASGRAYLQIQAQRRPGERLLPATRVMALRFARALPGGSSDGNSLRDRFAFLLLFHALAERARDESAAEPRSALPSREVFVAGLEQALRGVYRGS